MTGYGGGTMRTYVPISAGRCAPKPTQIPLDSVAGVRGRLAIRGTSPQTAGMPSAPRWQPERPEIRASDAERERVVSFLRDKTARAG